MRVTITGAGGNLGGKLMQHLETRDWCTAIVGIDVRPYEATSKTEMVVADLRDPTDRRWIDPVLASDAVVHFAAQNAAADSSWLEGIQSFDMTLNLLQQAGRQRKCRFLFASSNHAMGGYKDAPLPADGKLNGDTPPLAGTRFFDGTELQRPAAYGATKLYGERAVNSRAAASDGQLTGVSMRIGWVQRGENNPTAISVRGSGSSAKARDAAEELHDTTWFRKMWMSNRDFLALCEGAIRADASGWPTPGIVVSGMSNNEGMAWDLEPGRKYIGYDPVDDSFAVLRAAGIVA